MGKIKNGEAHIKLIENKYVSKKPYRCSISDKKEIESKITQLLKASLIENSPFAAVILVYKKEENRRSRLCVDFRDLNRLIVPELQPFPRIEDIMIKMINCAQFSALDINSTF